MTTPTGATREVFMSPSDVARLVGVNARTVIRWADEGKLPLSHRTPGGHRRFRKDDVDTFLEDMNHPPVG